MNWKEQFDKKFQVESPDSTDTGKTCDLCGHDHGGGGQGGIHIKNFISTEIIEKLIEDIGLDDHEKFDDGCTTEEFSKQLKQQLRDKWL